MSAESEALPTPQTIAKYVKQNTAKAAKSGMMMDMMHHEGGQEIVREEDYKGHHIVVSTTYKITVDNTEVTGHIMLTNDGQVQYHGLPNHSFDSTIDLVKALVDNFPEDFGKKAKNPASHGGAHDSMSGMDMGHGKGPGMGGMKMKMGAPAKAAKQKAKMPARKAGKKSVPAKSKRPAGKRK